MDARVESRNTVTAAAAAAAAAVAALHSETVRIDARTAENLYSKCEAIASTAVWDKTVSEIVAAAANANADAGAGAAVASSRQLASLWSAMCGV